MADTWCSPTIRTLLQGQFISICIAGTGIFATLLSEMKPTANFPLLMSFLNYFLLSFFLIRIYWRKTQTPHSSQLLRLSDDQLDTPTERKHIYTEISDTQVHIHTPQPTQTKWYWYFLAALLDVEANFLVILAYNYTSVTSIMLLDCFTIPSSMVLSYVILKYIYTYKHILGTCVCISGLVCIVINDVLYNHGDGNKDSVYGDVLCICGAVLYAFSNVLQETLVKNHDRDVFMGYLGVFGMSISFIQCMALDIHQLTHTPINLYVIMYVLGFVTCIYTMYIHTSAFLQTSDATLFNLSLLTSDVYAVLFVYAYQHTIVSPLYIVAFLLVCIGVYVYHTETPPYKNLQGGEEGEGE
ncbi:hypothetical protein EON63_24580, partial [archaeon]